VTKIIIFWQKIISKDPCTYKILRPTFRNCPANILSLDGVNRAVKKKIMIIVGALNIFSGVVLCVGVSFYASTVLEEYNGLNGLVNRGGMRGMSTSNRGATGERYVYGQCLFIGWGAMIIDIAAGAIMLCGSCGSSSSVGTESFMGTQGRLMSNQYPASNIENIVHNGFQQSKKSQFNDQEYL